MEKIKVKSVMATEKQREILRKKLLRRETISFQEAKFIFETNEQRNKFIEENEGIFNLELNSLGYNGCGYAVLDIKNLVLIAHEQRTSNFKNSKEYGMIDNKRYFKVKCSSWTLCIV